MTADSHNVPKDSCLFVFIRGCSSNHVLHAEMGRMVAELPFDQSHFGRANFLHCLLRAEILFAHKEDHTLNKLECVIQQ